VPRLRRTAVIIASAACMAAALTAAMTAPALAQPAHTLTQSAQTFTISLSTSALKPAYMHQAQYNDYACTDGDGLTDSPLFYRCTGGAISSKWVGSSCSPGQYDAETNYTVWATINQCHTRVWLHQYTYPEYTLPAGWAMCIPPNSFYELGLAVSPENIMVSDNTASCTPILP
jgi:hypothetical protein